MRNSLSAMLIATLASAGSLPACSTAANAQSCKTDEIVATGRASLTEAGARRNAIENWRRETLFKYGESWAEFERARDASIGRCAHTSFGLLLRCEARGSPAKYLSATARQSMNSHRPPAVRPTARTAIRT